MNGDITPNPAPPPKKVGKFQFLLIALGPFPAGLLFFTSRGFLEGQWYLETSAVVITVTLTFLCCLFGSIGMCGGFDRRDRPFVLLGGVALGIVLFLAELIALVYFGCTIAMSHH
jgi:hypothetical protein